jgi:hypothetical protein
MESGIVKVTFVNVPVKTEESAPFSPPVLRHATAPETAASSAVFQLKESAR